MIFTETEIAGVFLIEPEPVEDERGFFARVWCEREAGEAGIDVSWVQSSVSFNRLRGVLRGLHWQAAPHGEIKLVRCIRGAAYDVVVDLRRDSPTYTRHLAVDLSAQNRLMILIPQGVAHGFQALEDETVLDYRMSAFYEPTAGRGVRWNDPAFDIRWPIEDPIMTARDRDYPDFRP